MKKKNTNNERKQKKTDKGNKGKTIHDKNEIKRWRLEMKSGWLSGINVYVLCDILKIILSKVCVLNYTFFKYTILWACLNS